MIIRVLLHVKKDKSFQLMILHPEVNAVLVAVARRKAHKRWRRIKRLLYKLTLARSPAISERNFKAWQARNFALQF